MTMQEQERLVYEGEDYPLLSRPLEECLDPVVSAKIQSMIHDARMLNSSLHRNYRGHWVVRDGSLWLDDLDVLDEDRLAAIDPLHPRRGVAFLFPNATGAVPATWVTGELVLGTGETATHLYYREWPEHLILTVRRARCSGPSVEATDRPSKNAKSRESGCAGFWTPCRSGLLPSAKSAARWNLIAA